MPVDAPLEGFRFECQPGCSACCDTKGYVYLSEGDLVKAARFLGMTPAEFEAKYIYRTKLRMRLRSPRDGRQCHFLVEGRCSIHPAKPTQCRLFPFWPELVENRQAWIKAGKHCPGIGQGPLVQIGTAVEMAAEMKRAYPALYLRFAPTAGLED